MPTRELSPDERGRTTGILKFGVNPIEVASRINGYFSIVYPNLSNWFYFRETRVVDQEKLQQEKTDESW